MNSIQRRPDFEITVKRHDFSSTVYAPKTLVVFSAFDHDYPVDILKTGGVNFPGLLSYNYVENLANPDGAFSLVAAPKEDENGATLLDAIAPRDIVYFKEHGIVRFVGVVGNPRYTGEMGEAPNRRILINGYGIGGLISRMGFVLDQHLLPSGSTAKSAADKLMMELAVKLDAGKSMGDIVKNVVENYFKVQEAVIDGTALGIKALLTNLFDYTTKTSDLAVGYPFALDAYQTGVNTIWAILQQIFPSPVHELYGYFDDASGKYMLSARETPFDSLDWSNLPIHQIDPVMLLGYDVGRSDEDVYSFYLGLLPGSNISREQALVMETYRSAAISDTAMWQKYGFKPMYLEFPYFNHDKSGSFDAAQQMEKASRRMKSWYENNDKMFSGTIRFMNYVNSRKNITYPRIGDRFKFLSGEFYIEGTSRSWNYGGAMETSLTVNRGLDYSGDSPKMISNIGRRTRMIEGQ